jgi:methionyl aminopeptidase
MAWEVHDVVALVVVSGCGARISTCWYTRSAPDASVTLSPLNYRDFPKSVCTSVNVVFCHSVPDTYELQDSDIWNVDVTVYFGGFHGDLNDSYFVGNHPSE